MPLRAGLLARERQVGQVDCCRAAAVRHLSLLVKGRSFPIAGNEAPVSEALIRVTELPEDLTHTIIKFL